MTIEEYRRQVCEHAEKLGYSSRDVAVPAAGWTAGLPEYLRFEHTAAGCTAIIPAAPLNDGYISKAKGKLQAELNRAQGIQPKPRAARSPQGLAELDLTDDPARLEEPPDRFWALTLLRMVGSHRHRRFDNLMAKDGPGPSDAFQTGLVRLRNGLACANCGEAVASVSLAIYCGEFCQQMAGTVRYTRKAASEGRGEGDNDFLIGLGQRLVALFKGGYPVRARTLNQAQRAAMFARDGGVCGLCGGPADQIDHVSGDSAAPSNLRAVCGTCNRLLAMTAVREPTRRETAEFMERAGEVCTDLAARVAALEPGRCCDDNERWSAAEPRLRAMRRKRLQELEEAAETDFEDIDGYLRHSMQKDG